MEQGINIRLDEINGRIVFRDLIHNLHLIIMAVFIVLMSVQIYGEFFHVSEYQSTATLAVIVKGNTSGNLYSSFSTASAIAGVYSDIFEDQVIQEKVIETLGTVPKDVKITSTNIKGTNLLMLNVNAKSPKTAYIVIQAVLANYDSVSDYLFGNASVEVIKKPQVPTAPSNKFRIKFYTFFGTWVGGLLMTAGIVLLSILRNTVKMPKTARRNLEGECLGILCHEEKTRNLREKSVKKGLLLENPGISFRFEENYNQLASRLDYKMKEKMCQILMITSVAENEGKSTVAVNLAISLKKRNKKVLLIDLDLAKPALYKLLECGIPVDQGLNAFFEGKKNINEVLYHDIERGIYVVMNRRGINDGQAYLTSEKLRSLLSACRRVFDYVILDTSPLSAGTDAENVLLNADTSVLIVRQDRVEINDINNAIETLRDGNKKFMGYVLNDFDEAELGNYYNRTMRGTTKELRNRYGKI